MSGQTYLLPVWDTISTAWAKVPGSKGSFWGGIAIFLVIMFGIGVLQGITEGIPALSYIFKFIANILGYFIQLGLVYMGIKRAKDMSINFKMMFYTFEVNVALRLVGLYIMQMLILLIPCIIGFIAFLLFNLGGILSFLGILLSIAATISLTVLAIRMSISMGFVLDQGLAPWESIKKALEATRGNFWNLLGLFFIQAIIVAISAIPLGIGLIWTLPFSLIAFGVAYDRLSANA